MSGGGGCTLTAKVLKFECFSIDFPVCWTGLTEGVQSVIFGHLSPMEAPMKSSIVHYHYSIILEYY